MNNKLLKALVISGALVLSSNVSAAHLNLEDVDVWGLDVTGSGDVNNVTAFNYLDYDGASFADSTFDKGADATLIDAGDTFVDYGYLFSTGGNYNGQSADFGDYMVTSVFDNWTGTYTNATPFPLAPLSYDFETGDLTWKVWQTDANGIILGSDIDILTMSIVHGFGTFVPAIGEYVIDLTFEISDILQDNYIYYDINGDGILEAWEDLFDVALTTELGQSIYYTTTLSFVELATDPEATVGTIIEQYFLHTGELLDFDGAFGVAATNDGNLDAAKIPEPGMLSLMGLGLLGLAGLQRRRRQS
ncbi:PEP-CTERM sorting domain-containing protein [Vibrio hannami]|uniref:PEP-CTERM sorting domain-containing protein n=1 Tax=Vibrio hannami TaxID=2717094 RepID=UPI00240F47A6|nr:PEP-CTERM sorting domain-containing protein [Vibrio hannami]MDG3088297.1 PEP-CTERM sorting domain-containing protein [Vibrio hannami]